MVRRPLRGMHSFRMNTNQQRIFKTNTTQIRNKIVETKKDNKEPCTAPRFPNKNHFGTLQIHCREIQAIINHNSHWH